MVKPKLVSQINYCGRPYKHFDTEVIDPSICSDATLEKVKIMLEGVVENGTAKNLKNENFRIAGKTGTAQIANEKYGYRVDSKVNYQASFAGYFPAGDPKYSCIVVVNSPTNAIYYGNLVAGPVFREIANKVYASSFDLQPGINLSEAGVKDIPYTKNGKRTELEKVLGYLDLPVGKLEEDADWVSTTRMDDHIQIRAININESMMPDLKGMGVKDAIYLLENAGIQVRIRGRGRVVQQSVRAGELIKSGDQVVLTMSMT